MKSQQPKQKTITLAEIRQHINQVLAGVIDPSTKKQVFSDAEIKQLNDELFASLDPKTFQSKLDEKVKMLVMSKFEQAAERHASAFRDTILQGGDFKPEFKQEFNPIFSLTQSFIGKLNLYDLTSEQLLVILGAFNRDPPFTTGLSEDDKKLLKELKIDEDTLDSIDISFKISARNIDSLKTKTKELLTACQNDMALFNKILSFTGTPLSVNEISAITNQLRGTPPVIITKDNVDKILSDSASDLLKTRLESMSMFLSTSKISGHLASKLSDLSAQLIKDLDKMDPKSKMLLVRHLITHDPEQQLPPSITINPAEIAIINKFYSEFNALVKKNERIIDLENTIESALEEAQRLFGDDTYNRYKSAADTFLDDSQALLSFSQDSDQIDKIVTNFDVPSDMSESDKIKFSGALSTFFADIENLQKAIEAAEVQRLKATQDDRLLHLNQYAATREQTHLQDEGKDVKLENKEPSDIQFIHPDIFDSRVIRDIQVRKDIVNVGGDHKDSVGYDLKDPLHSLDSPAPDDKATERLRNIFTVTVTPNVTLKRSGGMGESPQVDYPKEKKDPKDEKEEAKLPTITVVSAHGIQFENPIMNTALFFLKAVPQTLGKDKEYRNKFINNRERLLADAKLRQLDDQLHRTPTSTLPPPATADLKGFELDRGAILNYYKYILYNSLHPFAGQDAYVNMVTLGGKYFSMLPEVQEGEVNKITAPLYYQALREVLAEHPDEFKKMNIRICAHDEHSRAAAKQTFGFTDAVRTTDGGQVIYGEYHDVTKFDKAQLDDARLRGKKLVIINPADQHANLGNELCYGSVEALIGENTDIVRKSPFCNPNALKLSSYTPVVFGAALRTTAALEAKASVVTAPATPVVTATPQPVPIPAPAPAPGPISAPAAKIDVTKGVFAPIDVRFGNGSEADYTAQAHKILTDALKLKQQGHAKIGITYSANHGQTIALGALAEALSALAKAKDPNNGPVDPKEVTKKEAAVTTAKAAVTAAFAPSRFQGGVVRNILKLIETDQYKELQNGAFQILPISTCNASLGLPDPKWVEDNLKDIDKFINSGGYALGWRNQDTKDKYAVGNGIVTFPDDLSKQVQQHFAQLAIDHAPKAAVTADLKSPAVVPLPAVKPPVTPLPAPKSPEVKSTVAPAEDKEIKAIDSRLSDALDAYAKQHFKIPKEVEKDYKPKFKTVIERFLARNLAQRGLADLSDTEKEELIARLAKGNKIPVTHGANMVSDAFFALHSDLQKEVVAANADAALAKSADEMISDARNQLLRLGIDDPDPYLANIDLAKNDLLHDDGLNIEDKIALAGMLKPDGIDFGDQTHVQVAGDTFSKQIDGILSNASDDPDLILKNAIRNVVDYHLRLMGKSVSEPLSDDLAAYQRMCNTLYVDIINSGISRDDKIDLAAALSSSRSDVPELGDPFAASSKAIGEFYSELAHEVLKQSIADRCNAIYNSQIPSSLLSRSEIKARQDTINEQIKAFDLATEDLSGEEKLAIAKQLREDAHTIAPFYDEDEININNRKKNVSHLKKVNEALAALEKNVKKAAAETRQSATAYAARVDHYIHNTNHLLARLRSIYAGFGQVKDFEPYYKQVYDIKKELLALQEQFDETLPGNKKVLADLKDALKRVDDDIALMESKAKAIKDSAGAYKKGLKYIPSFADQSEVFEGTPEWEKEIRGQGKEFTADVERKPAILSLGTEGTQKDIAGWTENIGKNAFRKNRLFAPDGMVLADYIEGIDPKTEHLVSEVTALHSDLQTDQIFCKIAAELGIPACPPEKQEEAQKNAEAEINALCSGLANYLKKSNKYLDDKDAIKEFLSSPHAKSIITNGGGPHSNFGKTVAEASYFGLRSLANTMVENLPSAPIEGYILLPGKIAQQKEIYEAKLAKKQDYFDKLDTIALSMIHSHVALNRNVSKNPFIITSAQSPDLAKRLVVAAELWNKNNPDHPISYLDRSGYGVMENVDRERARTTGDKVKDAACTALKCLGGLLLFGVTAAVTATGIGAIVTVGAAAAVYNLYKYYNNSPIQEKSPGFQSEAELQKEVIKLNNRLMNVSKAAAADVTKTAADKLTGKAEQELAKSPLAKIAGKVMPPKSKRTTPDTRPVSADRASPKTADLKRDLAKFSEKSDELKAPPAMSRRR